MHPVQWIVWKKLRKGGAETVLLMLSAALLTACLIMLFSLSAGYLRFYLQQTENLGLDAWETAKEGFLHIAQMIGSFHHTPETSGAEGPLDGLRALILESFGLSAAQDPIPEIDYLPGAADLFSARAALKNLPAMLVLTDSGGSLTVICAVALLFSVFKKQRRHFYASLLISGMSPGGVRRCAAAEGVLLSLAGIPVGSVLGAVGMSCLRSCARFYSGRDGIPFPVRLRVSPPAAFAAVFFAATLILLFSLGAVRRLSVKRAFTETRNTFSADIGINAFTDSARKYRLLGAPHYIALRNISNHLGKYALMFLMTAWSMTELGIFLFSLTLIGNSNLSAYFSEQQDAVVLLAACRFFFYASAGTMQGFLIFATLFGMLSNIESNAGIYALMRSAGASRRCLRATVRREGLYCAVLGVLLGAVGTMTFAGYILSAYDGSSLDKTVNITGVGSVIPVMAASAACYVITMAAATELAVVRSRKNDVIAALKEIAYT